jgi:hypothetical protein
MSIDFAFLTGVNIKGQKKDKNLDVENPIQEINPSIGDSDDPVNMLPKVMPTPTAKDEYHLTKTQGFQVKFGKFIEKVDYKIHDNA